MIAAALRKTEPFRDMDRDALRAIACQATDRPLVAGEALFEQGEPAERFFLALGGRLKATMIVPDGKQVLLQLINPGDFCGLASVLACTEYQATCRAIVATSVLAWPTSYWGTLFEGHPRIAVSLTQALGRHVAEVQTRIAEFATQPVERRVANAVLRLVRSAGTPTEGGVRVDFPITRQDLAELTASTLHSVSRIVSAWCGLGILGRGRACLVVRDLAALERIARGDSG